MAREERVLLAIALFGLIVPNNLFVYWLLHDFAGWDSVVHDRLALAFILDAFLALGVLAYFFAVRPIGPVKWYWFVGLSVLGGLGFSLPLYWWLNRGQTRGRTPPGMTLRGQSCSLGVGIRGAGLSSPGPPQRYL